LKYIISYAKAKKHDDLNTSNNLNSLSALIDKNKFSVSRTQQLLPPIQKPIHHSSSYSIPNYNLILNINTRNDSNADHYEINGTTSLRSKYKKSINNNHIMKDYDSCDV
jgi:hypothetical protein